MRPRRSESASVRNRPAFVQAELVVSIGLVLVVAALAAVVVLQYAAVRREVDARRVLTLTAANELNRIRAGLAPRPHAWVAPTEPLAVGETRIATSARPGVGAWSGCTQVRVVVSRQFTATRDLAVELAAYLPAEDGR